MNKMLEQIKQAAFNDELEKIAISTGKVYRSIYNRLTGPRSPFTRDNKLFTKGKEFEEYISTFKRILDMNPTVLQLKGNTPDNQTLIRGLQQVSKGAQKDKLSQVLFPINLMFRGE